MKEHEDGYQLSTRRIVYANGGILGISPHAWDSKGPKAYEGYDGYLNDGDEGFTQEERREVADFAISMWNEWASMPEPTNERRENVYTCEKCGGFTVTVDVDEGVTPFTIRCRAKDETMGVKRYNVRVCDGMATSAFYPKGPRPSHIPEPEWEWYKPSQDEFAKLDHAEKDHVHQGGLLLRRITTVRGTSPLDHRNA